MNCPCNAPGFSPTRDKNPSGNWAAIVAPVGHRGRNAYDSRGLVMKGGRTIVAANRQGRERRSDRGFPAREEDWIREATYA
jgi:hypothetical protein